jgi:HAMP domain-containing protein
MLTSRYSQDQAQDHEPDDAVAHVLGAVLLIVGILALVGGIVLFATFWQIEATPPVYEYDQSGNSTEAGKAAHPVMAQNRQFGLLLGGLTTAAGVAALAASLLSFVQSRRAKSE